MRQGEQYIERLQQALQTEYEFEKAYFRQQAEQRGIERLMARGECWFPVSTGQVGHNSLGQLTIDLQRDYDTEAEPQFEYGASVVFFHADTAGQLRYCAWSGFVNFVDGNRMVVVLPKESAIADVARTDRLGIQLSFNERSYQLQFAALRQLKTADEKAVVRLRSVLLGQAAPEWSKNADMGFAWLNASQEAAVNHVLRARDVAIVHGPPGTGKTTTLVEAIYETLRREEQVMVCAQSNMAVDWIASQLMDRGLQVLRVGNPSRVTDRMLEATYERRFAAHPSYPELWAVRNALRSKLTHDKRARLKDRALQLELEIRQDLFSHARVFACTLTGAGNPVLQGMRFHSIFIDEAAQATEPACWIAMLKADRVVLAGDHCQLPPTLKTPEAMKSALGVTLMERVAAEKPQAVKLLTMQYRMHPDIMRFPSDYFYDGRLEASPTVLDRGVFDLDSPMVWYDTAQCNWQEYQPAESTSRINPEEAAFVVRMVEDYVKRLGTARLLEARCDFGIISPYQAQIRLLRRLVKKSATLRPLRRLISVNTVDGFQGQERDVIVISMVRANDNGQIGFLNDLRRMNVAITRARYKVMIVGDAQTLGRHRFYRQLYEHVSNCGRIADAAAMTENADQASATGTSPTQTDTISEITPTQTDTLYI